jgi:hypothetical protein
MFLYSAIYFRGFNVPQRRGNWAMARIIQSALAKACQSYSAMEINPSDSPCSVTSWSTNKKHEIPAQLYCHAVLVQAEFISPGCVSSVGRTYVVSASPKHPSSVTRASPVRCLSIARAWPVRRRCVPCASVSVGVCPSVRPSIINSNAQVFSSSHTNFTKKVTVMTSQHHRPPNYAELRTF